MNASISNLLSTIVATFAPVRPTRVSFPSSAVDSTEPVEIQKRSTLKIAKPLGRTVTCLTGTVWVTVDCDCRDHVLEAGQSFAPTTDKLMMVHALEQSTVRIVTSRGR